MIFKKPVLVFLFVFLSNSIFAQNLILSDKLQMKFDDPLLISHTVNTLIIKYDEWSFVHEIVTPESIYQKVNLSGLERLFLMSIFDEKERLKLPNWLQVLSAEQAESFGVKKDNIKRKSIGEADLVAVFNSKQSISQIYLFENLKIHHFVVHGNEKVVESLIGNIGER